MKKFYLTALIVLFPIASVTFAQDVIVGGNMEDAGAWETSMLNTDAGNTVNYEFNYTSDSPAEGDGGCLWVSGTNTGTDGGMLTNIMFYQQVTLERGTTYGFNGAYKDIRTNNFWTEVYVGGNEPAEGSDYGGDQGAVLVSGFKSTNWETECPSDAFDGTFAEDACTPGTTNQVYFEGEGDTTVYFGFRMGIWDDSGSGYSFEVFIDNISLVAGAVTSAEAGKTSEPVVYPNPVTDKLHVSSAVALKSLQVINLTGQEVLSYDNIRDHEFSIDLSKESAGIYLVVIRDVDGNLTYKKIFTTY